MLFYRYSEFNPNPIGHGGEKRSYQIVDFLKRNKIEVIDVSISKYSTCKINILIRIWYLLLAFYYNLKYNFKIRSLKTLKKISIRIKLNKDYLRNLTPNSVFIYEHSVNIDWLFPIIAKEHQCLVICFPHNIESLVKNQSFIFDQKHPEGFLNEIQILKKCDLVFTISKEEEWLLNLFDINTYYFPYWPSISEIKKLKEIRLKRNVRKLNGHYLIIGSYGNPPTKQGLINLSLETTKKEYLDYTFHIAGYNTDKLTTELNYPSNHFIYGSISVEDLFELYQKVDAVIIYQIPSTGALTKVPELLLAGIPVIINRNAARNFFSIPGVHVYYELGELASMLYNFENKLSFLEYSTENEDDYIYIEKILKVLQINLKGS